VTAADELAIEWARGVRERQAERAKRLGVVDSQLAELASAHGKRPPMEVRLEQTALEVERNRLLGRGAVPDLCQCVHCRRRRGSLPAGQAGSRGEP
jgi:hypothetical protein